VPAAGPVGPTTGASCRPGRCRRTDRPRPALEECSGSSRCSIRGDRHGAEMELALRRRRHRRRRWTSHADHRRAAPPGFPDWTYDIRCNGAAGSSDRGRRRTPARRRWMWTPGYTERRQARYRYMTTTRWPPDWETCHRAPATAGTLVRPMDHGSISD